MYANFQPFRLAEEVFLTFLKRAAIPTLCLGVLVARPQQSDTPALETLTQNLHREFTLRNAEGILKLWSDTSPQRKQQAAALEKLLGTPSQIAETAGEDPDITGYRARVPIQREVILPANFQGSPQKQRLVLECIKENGGWKIWREIPAEQDLGEHLAAGGKEEQEKLLAENAELVNAALANAVIDLGRGARNRGQFPQALALYDLASRVAGQANAGQACASALNNGGLVRYDQGDFTAALASYRASVAVSQEAHDDSGAARALNNMGAIYMDVGDYGAAWEIFNQCRTVGERLHDNRLIANADGKFGIGE